MLQLQTFTSLLETMAAGLQGRAVQLIDLSVGSVLRAVLESSASVALWMQWLILQVLATTRASTSSGTDLDSWMADFSFYRLPGSLSRGTVTFSRFTTGLPAIIPLQTTVLTADGTLSFYVVKDASNPSWSEQLSGYCIAASIASVVVPVEAVVPGLSGNVLAGTVTLLGSALPGVDRVINLIGFGGGDDMESDAALRARFQLYINSRSLATAGAVESAVSGLQQGVRFCVLENVELDGSPAPGHFCVVADDGSGVASASFLESVSVAVDAVRPVGTTFSVTAAAVLPVTVQMSVVTSSLSSSAATVGAVQQAVTSWIGDLPMGGRVAVSKLEALAHGVGSLVVSVPITLVNGIATDLSAAPGTIFSLVAINVSASL